jgi:hypothetical protein
MASFAAPTTIPPSDVEVNGLLRLQEEGDGRPKRLLQII